MSNDMKKQLFEIYKNKSDLELRAIVDDDSYEPYAREVAKEILESDRQEYYQEKLKKDRAYEQKIAQQKAREKEKSEKKEQTKMFTQKAVETTIKSPEELTVDKAVVQIANDLRVIKILAITALSVSLIGALFTTITQLITIIKYM